MSNQRAVEPTSTDAGREWRRPLLVIAHTPTAWAGTSVGSSPTASASALRSASASYSMASVGTERDGHPFAGGEPAGEASAVAARDAGEDACVAEAGDDVHGLAAVLASRRSVAVAVVRSAGTMAVAGVDVDVVAAQADGDGATERGRLQRRAAEDLTVARPAVVGPLADQPVGHADERRDVLGRRTLEDMLGGVVLLDASVAHDGQPVTEGERLGLVVGDEHGGEAEPTVELVDLGPHLVAQTGVEVAERFVEQHQVGSGDEAAGQRDALLLATAELRRIAVEERAAIHEGRGLLDPTALQALLDPPRLAAGSRCSCAPSCAATARTTGTPCRCCACPATG